MTLKRILITGGSGFIGTNLIDELRKYDDISILNIDLAAPKLTEHHPYWRECDVRDRPKMEDMIMSFKPDAVVHLAARTDLGGRTLADYSTNTDGTTRLLEALDFAKFVGPAVFASSMYVCRPGYKPTSDTDFAPHTTYGESKVEGEKIIRAFKPSYPWIIVRPTSIWGPRFGIPYIDFFKMVLAKRYVNISNNETKKTYGYVGNTVAQIVQILKNAETLTCKVVYLGDWPAYVINEWADELAAFVPYRIPNVPRLILSGLALVGDIGKLVGISFPMSSFRLQNMTTDNVHDLSILENLPGTSLPYTRQQGNALTVSWLRSSSTIRLPTEE